MLVSVQCTNGLYLIPLDASNHVRDHGGVLCFGFPEQALNCAEVENRLFARQALAFALAVLLFVACGSPLTSGTTAPSALTVVPANTTVETPRPTLEPTPTPKLTKTPAIPTVEPQGTPIAPFDEAPMISFYGWSHDSTWLTYWTFTAAEAHETYGVPRSGAGELHFLNVHSGQTCPFPDQAGYGDSVIWQPHGTVIVATRDSAKQGLPCNGNFTVGAKLSYSNLNNRNNGKQHGAATFT
jgi:hypothetical protein